MKLRGRAGFLLASLVVAACAVTEAGPSAVSPTVPAVLEVESAVPAAVAAAAPSKTSSAYSWKPLPLGGGGMVTGIDITSSGVMRVRTDTYGTYLREGNEWQQQLLASRMPAEQRVPNNAGGVLAVATAPSNSKRAYHLYRGLIYRSDDGGENWKRTGFAGTPVDANGPTRTWGPRLAVDPVNADRVLLGTPKGGAFLSTDGAATWQAVSVDRGSQLSNGWDAGISFVAFDPSGGSTSGVTQRLVVASAGSGLFASNDAGRTWARIEGGPKTISNAEFADDGTLVVSAFTENEDPKKGIWILKGNEWRQQALPSTFEGGNEQIATTVVTIDRKNSRRIVVIDGPGNVSMTEDGGASWRTIEWDLVGGDVPWLVELGREKDNRYLTTGDAQFDPTDPSTVWVTMGVGVLKFSGLAAGAVSSKVTSVTKGIEQLVVSRVIVPPGGKPVVAVHDFGTFYVEDENRFAVVKGPVNRFIGAWSVDYSPFDSKYLASDVVNIINEGDMLSGTSLDGGRRWEVFPARPRDEKSTGRNLQEVRFTGCGSIAVSQPGNILWQPTGQFMPWNDNRYGGCFRTADSRDALLPHITTDGGRTWQKIELPGVGLSEGEVSAFDFEYFLARRNIAADKVTPGMFYLFHGTAGTFRSADQGKTWERMSATPAGDSYKFNVDFQSVPDRAGHLFLTDGGQGGNREIGPNELGGLPFYRSTDGGRSWAGVSRVDWVSKFGFGKPATPGGYPTIFIFGRVDSRFGFWRSTDDTKTWVKIGDFAGDSLDNVVSIEGDLDVFGKVYVGFGGSGVTVGEPGTATKSTGTANPAATKAQPKSTSQSSTTAKKKSKKKAPTTKRR